MNKLDEVHTANIPVVISGPGSKHFNLDIVLKNIQNEVRKILPDAKYRSMVFNGKCQDLPDPRGRITFNFIEVHGRNLEGDQIVYAADAVVDIGLETMELDVWDMTPYYPTTDLDPIPMDKELNRVFQTASEFILGEAIAECKITIGQRNNLWYVSCFSEAEGKYVCDFDIDGSSFEVIDE